MRAAGMTDRRRQSLSELIQYLRLNPQRTSRTLKDNYRINDLTFDSEASTVLVLQIFFLVSVSISNLVNELSPYSQLYLIHYLIGSWLSVSITGSSHWDQ